MISFWILECRSLFFGDTSEVFLPSFICHFVIGGPNLFFETSELQGNALELCNWIFLFVDDWIRINCQELFQR